MAEAPGSVRKEALGTLAPESDLRWIGRAEIDTSAPFESVKEAVTRFGGSAPWRPQSRQRVPFDPETLDSSKKHHCFGEVDIAIVVEQTAKLENDLIVKELETVDVLKELEMTERIVDELKLKLQNEASEVIKISENSLDTTEVHPIIETEEKTVRLFDTHLNTVGSSTRSKKSPELIFLEGEDRSPALLGNRLNEVGPSTGSKPSPGLIFMELKEAKVNLNRTTSDLSGIKASVESLNSKIDNEKISLEKTLERLIANSAKISSLEEELNQTRLKLQLTKNAEINGRKNSSAISKESHQLSSETEQLKKTAEAAKYEVSKMTTEIEQTKASIKASEIRWLAAKKLEAEAKAAEAVALAVIKALTNCEKSTAVLQNSSVVTLSVEEYDTLTRKAWQAEELSMKHIEAAMVQVDEAHRSKLELLKKVEEATAEVETSRKALEAALDRVEAANRGKLAIEEALWKWRSEHVHKRRLAHNSTKFKNSCPCHQRRDSRMLDVNGYSLITDGSKTASRPTLSIGQILSRKLLVPEKVETATRVAIHVKPKVLLGQMLSKRHGALSPQSTKDRAARKHFSAKRKKFGFVGISLILAKQSKKNDRKMQAWCPK